MLKGTCPVCGKEFMYYPSHKAKFCSRECYHKYYRGKNHPWYKGKVKLTCPQCGKQFLIQPSWAKQGVKFCSKECRIKWMKEHLKGERNPNFKGGKIKLTCQQCGRKFEVDRWKTDRKYCSRECVAKAQKWHKIKRFYTCANCGKLFYAKRIPAEKHFCSKKCQFEYSKGENNPFYRGKFSEEALRKIIKARHARPNRAERRLIKIIEDNNLPFRYVGDGKVIIGGKNPDFIHKEGEKKVIELFGIYWHSPIYGRVRPTMTPDYVKKHYKKHGYDCLIIWDVELKNTNRIIDKIMRFAGGMKVAPLIVE